MVKSKSGTSSGELANLYAGIAHLQLGQYSAAIDFLKDYSPAGTMMPIIKNGVMGDAYSELNEFDNALNYYQKAVSAGDNEMLTPYYLLKLGMLNLKQNNYEASKDAFLKIKEKYPLSQINRDAEKYLSRVEAKL
ncbi:MAG: tetratricopeptide repeat protein [Bacteroidota bacterium]